MKRFLQTCRVLTWLVLVGCSGKKIAVETPTDSVEVGLTLGALPDRGLEMHERLAEELANVEPTKQEWESEAFTEKISDIMKKGVAAWLVKRDEESEKMLEKALAADTETSALRPRDRMPIYQSHEVFIMEGGDDSSAHRGRDAFRKELAALSKPLEEATSRRAKFKVKHVAQHDDSVEAHLLFEWRGKLSAGWTQITSVWHTHWTSEEPYQLKRVEVRDYREALPGEGRIEFTDIAPRVLARESAYNEHLAHSFDYWRSRSDRSLVADLLGAQGVAVGDVNGDLRDDVYILQPGGLPNRLLVHQANGSAKDVAYQSGVAILDFCRSALLIDLDNDGDNDLVVALAWAVALFENDGAGQFTKHSLLPSNGQINSMAAADYDADGHIDLYVCGRDASGALKAEQGALGIPMPYYDANNGGPNMLLRNERGFKLRDVTREVGMDVNNRRFSLACAWEDFDNDGDQDLYVANDFGRNNLFRNDNGRFTDIAFEAGVVDIGPGMSAAWGDHNGDGLMDLYVGNMWSNAGNRITLQEAFLPKADKATKAQARRHARGNSVYINLGDGTFKDVTRISGANMARWAWSSNFIDLNNDGDEDLVVANGMITTEDTGDL